MYEIERQGVLIDDLIVKEEGREITVHVDISMDAIARDFDETWKAFENLKTRLDDGDLISEVIEDFGACARKLFNIIFGNEAEKIFNFYGDRNMEMIRDFYPYISKVIIPKINEAQMNILDEYKDKK